MNAQPANAHVVGETYREKATRKFKENPFVPIGAVATTAALVVAMVKMRRGESRSFNNWLRVRVLAQAVTICAVVVGTYSFGRRGFGVGLGQAPAEADLERRREEKMGRERTAFEERLRAAEEVHSEEVGRTTDGLITGIATRGAREKLEGRARANASARVGPDVSSSSSATSNRSGKGKSGGWMAWLGWGGPSSES